MDYIAIIFEFAKGELSKNSDLELLIVICAIQIFLSKKENLFSKYKIASHS